MMQIDFEDVHGVTGWSTEDVLLLHKKLPGMKQYLRFIKKTFDNTTLLYLYNLITISIKYSATFFFNKKNRRRFKKNILTRKLKDNYFFLDILIQ